jgi:hypothetical protein
MAGAITKALATAASTPSGSAATATSPATAATHQNGDGPTLLVPAGFIADILGGLSGTIGEITGGYFGNAPLGRQIGDTASSIVKCFPFQVIPPSVAPQSAGPDGAATTGHDEALVVVPAGFLGGLLGGIGGNLLGGTIGSWFGGESTGSTIGKTAGGVLGGLLPFQVVPPSLTPQSVGPGGAPQQEPMVVVPASFFGNLLSGVAGTFADLVGNDTGREVAKIAAPILEMLPFQDVPRELAPQSVGPGGASVEERMIVVPAGFFGSLLSGFAGTIGGAVGGMFGSSGTGAAVGGIAAPILEMLPFHVVPPSLTPQSSGPTSGAAQEQLMFVPAGLFGSLLSGLAGSIGSTVGDWFGSEGTGEAVGNAVAPILDLIPFHAAPRAAIQH